MTTDNTPAPDCQDTAYLTCPWLRGVYGGRCLNRCDDEPVCTTDAWEPRNAAGEPITITDEELDQIAEDRWYAATDAELRAEIAANVCTPAELAAIQREQAADDEYERREFARYNAELLAAITDTAPPR